jgi:hypothetical protein
MGEVALSRIEYGAKSKRLPDGSYEEVQPAKVVMPGESLPSGGFTDAQKDELRAAGALGEEVLLRTNAQSTAATLQSEEFSAQSQADLAGAKARSAVPASPPTEEEIAKAHRLRTDEVLRESGKDVDAAVAEEEKAAKKAADADAKAAKAGKE